MIMMNTLESRGEDACESELALKQLANTQSMIDIMATKLVEFRGLGLNEFTLQEIRRLEGKLIKHFCQQLDTKRKFSGSNDQEVLKGYPSLSKWLIVVGVGAILAERLKFNGSSVEYLLKLSEMELHRAVMKMGGSTEDHRKLSSSLKQLRIFQKQDTKKMDMTNIYWDSWSKSVDNVFPTEHDYNENLNHKSFIENGDMNASSSRHGSESSDTFDNSGGRIRTNTDPSTTDMPPVCGFPRTQPIPSTSSSCLTPPSPSHLSFGSRSSLESESGPRSNPSPPPSKLFVVPPFQPTPPVTPGTPHKVPHHVVGNNQDSTTSSKSVNRDRVLSTGTSLGRPNKTGNSLLPPFNQLKQSKSSEWHFPNRITSSVATDNTMSASNHSLSSITTLPPTSARHPKTTKKVKPRPGNLILNDRDVPNFIHISRSASRRSSTTISPEGGMGMSPLSPRTPLTPATPCNPEIWSRDRDLAAIQSPRTPKTPKSGFKTMKNFLVKISKRTKLKRNRSTEVLDEVQSSQPRERSDTLPSTSHNNQPQSKDVGQNKPRLAAGVNVCPGKPPHDFLLPSGPSSAASSRPSSFIDTDRTITGGTDGTADTVGTNGPNDMADTVASNGTNNTDQPPQSDGDDPAAFRANLFRQGSTMQSEEWDIPYSELEKWEMIGCGRVGTVYRGNWHGEVAIREIDININDEDKLQAFKQEVMIYKKVRHENLELFMGSCMNPPHLAIVNGFCRGHSLYNYIRGGKSNHVTVNQAKVIAQHIVQGMGYLHSKGIIHKDLKSKNIFVDGKRVVITDFGLVGLHAVSGSSGSRKSKLSIPDGWLCYLAPEVIRAIRFPAFHGDDVISTLPYTKKSDVYAFGTVWYELLAGAWPFEGCPAESVIWQVSHGKKQNLSQLQGGKDVKTTTQQVRDIVMAAWSYDPDQRPDFSDAGIMELLKRLQVQILRSYSSHPRRPGANRTHDRYFDAPTLRHANFQQTMHDLAE